MKYAEILNTVVINIIEADLNLTWPFETQLIQINENEMCEPGYLYNPNEMPRFIKQSLPKVFTSYEFILRLTATERASIRTAAITDVNIADFLQLSQAAQEIDTSNPMTIQGMNYLVNVGLLTEQRKNEILGV